ncbi:MAG: metal transporter, partial [Halobacteria archaeon]|nr:metal transporter [Halobacteria archaeon]
MAEVHEHEKAEQPFGMPRWVTALLPLVLLALIVGGFVVADPLSDLRQGQPLPDVTITNAELPNDETIIVHVTNNGPEEVTISQVLVDEAYWSYEVINGDNTLGRGESAAIRIPYHWNQGADHEVTLVLSSGATFSHTIVGAQRTVGLGIDVLLDLALMGLFVGVIPVALGMLWFPYIRSMTDRWIHAVLAFSAGVLAFLMFDAGFEALEIAEAVPGIFDGKIIIVLGTLGALLLVQSVSSWREGRESSGDTRAGS